MYSFLRKKVFILILCLHILLKAHRKIFFITNQLQKLSETLIKRERLKVFATFSLFGLIID